MVAEVETAAVATEHLVAAGAEPLLFSHKILESVATSIPPGLADLQGVETGTVWEHLVVGVQGDQYF